MISFIVKMLSSEENISSNRLMFIIWNIALIGMTVYFINEDKFDETVAVFFVTVLTIVWSGKVTQSYTEKINKQKLGSDTKI